MLKDAIQKKKINLKKGSKAKKKIKRIKTKFNIKIKQNKIL